MSSIKNSRVYTAPVPKMPPGLVELMEGLAKEVLRNNPTDVYTFCATHMQKLLEIRDGPNGEGIFKQASKRVLTLEQKIAIATEKVKERAARRRENYDKNIQVYKEPASNNESCEIKVIDNNHLDAGQYIKEKIVKIPEKDLFGDVEHEIIAKVKETTSLSDSVKPTEIEAETILTENQSVNLLIPVTQKNDISNDGMDFSQINSYDNADRKDDVKEIKNNKKNDDEEIEKNQKDIEIISKDFDSVDKVYTINYEENCLESSAKMEIENENQYSNKSIENGGQLESQETSNKCDDQENPAEVNILIIEGNNTEKINNISNTLDEQREINNFKETSDIAIHDSNIEQTSDIDKTTLHSATETEKVDKSDKNNDLLMGNENVPVPSDLREEDDILKAKYNHLQSHVNNTSMDLETAAITIQKVFRSFLFRNKTLSSDDATNVDINLLIEDKQNKNDSDIPSMNIINKDRRTLGLTRIDTVLQTVNEEKSLSQSTDDSSTLSSAATIIQAHVRGFLVRNKFNVNKNSSTTSGVDSDGLSFTSIEGENDYRKNKTILNIHIVPETGHFLSRDESMLTSIDLSLDGSPPCSTNLHPLGYDRSERRKQLKREDAIQSISPPTYNSGKLSEDVDSVKEILVNNRNSKDEDLVKTDSKKCLSDSKETSCLAAHGLNDVNISTMVDNLDTALEVKSLGPIESPVKYMTERPHSLPEMNSDEMDVITPFTPVEEKLSGDSKYDNLIHSGEFHEVVLPTKLSRSDTSVVRGE